MQYNVIRSLVNLLIVPSTLTTSTSQSSTDLGDSDEDEPTGSDGTRNSMLRHKIHVKHNSRDSPETISAHSEIGDGMAAEESDNEISFLTCP